MAEVIHGLRHHLVRAFDDIERRHDEIDTTHGGSWPSHLHGTMAWRPGRPIPVEWWPWWPDRGRMTALAGPVGRQVGWALSTADAAAQRGEPVLVVVPTGMQRWVVNVLIAHAGIPLARLVEGRLRPDEWPRLSKRMGRLAEAPISVITPIDDPGRLDPATTVVGVCLDDGDVAGWNDRIEHSRHRGVLVAGWASHGADLRLVAPDADHVGLAGVGGAVGFDWPTLQVVQSGDLGVL